MRLIPQEYSGESLSNDLRGYRRLWGAVFYMGLQDAARELAVFLNPKNTRPEDSFAALAWLNSDRRTGPGSFVQLCEMFDLEPNRARNAWRAKVRPLINRAREADRYYKKLEEAA